MNTALTIYHGSDHIIKVPEYGKGKPSNDYGRGFYCTEHLDLAREWACDESHDGYANRYLLEVSGLKILDLNNYTILHWLTMLLQNRRFTLDTSLASAAHDYLIEHFSIDTTGFDIIKGYRADDSYFSFARDFLHNGVSIRRLEQAMKLGELGNQIVLISPGAFKSIEFTGYENAKHEIYYPLRHRRDILARAAYLNDRHGVYLTEDDLYMIDIMREGIKANDPRLQ